MGDIGKPVCGGRFTLLRGAEAGGRLHYGVALLLPAAEWSGELTVTLGDGEVAQGADWQAVDDTQEEPPWWLLEQARAALRSCWRAWSKAQGESIATHFPRRITRWRAEPEATTRVAARQLAGRPTGERE